MTVRRGVGLALAALFATGTVAACKRSSGPARPPAGTERGDCRGDGGCDDGLQCRSNLCVRPPPADCGKVAEQLSYLLLDNYAPQEQRAAFVAELRRQCQDTHLDKDDGECLVRAKHRAELRECPRPLGIGDCEKIKTHVEQLRGTGGVDPYLVTGADRIVGRCKGEAPTLAFEQCVLAARSLDDVERCPW